MDKTYTQKAEPITEAPEPAQVRVVVMYQVDAEQWEFLGVATVPKGWSATKDAIEQLASGPGVYAALNLSEPYTRYEVEYNATAIID